MNEPEEREEQDPAHPHSGAIEIIAAEHAQAKPGSRPIRWSLPWFQSFVAQLLKFGLVGGVSVFVDIGAYTLLRTTVLSPEVHPLGPMLAKVLATLVAILWSWIGNRFWTFRHARASGRHTTREGLEFLGVSLAGMVIGLVPLWITHYVLHWDSLLVENLANLVGIGLGSIFRFALYRWWVYSPRRLHLRESTPA
ncbi:GtrA family protein [Gulosibacter sp. 10]|uniref:GtrA family protein n=1 Tax=Gulosibacter sp. 10 TaxID=1255570 RepID=UPI000B34C2C7|nr:GtrA family protein [Gulosibacter sp. 10]